MFRSERPSSEGYIKTGGNWYYNVIGQYQYIHTMSLQYYEYKVFAFFPQLVCMFRVVLTINSVCFPEQHQPVGLCSGDNVFPVRYELNIYI
jgi:hypothetical protein